MAATSDKELERLLRKDVTEWSVSDVAMWMSSTGLEEFKIPFIENSISGLELGELDDDDLKCLGMKRLGTRKRLMISVRRLLEGKTSDSSTDGGSVASADSWDTHSTGSARSGSRRSSSSSGSGRRRSEYQVKAYYKEKTVIFTLSNDDRLSNLKSKVKRQFGTRMTLKWKDEDGDKVSLRKQRDWRNCKKYARSGRIRVYCTQQRSRKSAAVASEMAVLQTMTNPVMVINETGTISFANDAALKTFGYLRSMLIGSKVNMLMPVEHAENHDEYLARYIRTGEARVIGSGRHLEAVKKDGTTFPIFLTLSESKTRGERAFIGTIQDLSGKVDEDIVERDQTSHYTLLESILDAAIVINEVGTVQFYNSAASDLFGHKTARVVGRNISMLMQGRQKREHDGYLKKYLETGIASVIGTGRDVVAAHKDGHLIPVRLSVSEQQVGKKRLYTGIIRPKGATDDEEESSSTAARRTTLEEMREVLDDLMVAAIIIDDHGTVQAFNESAQELTGYSLLDVLGKNINMLMCARDASKHDGYLAKWRETGEEHVFGVGRDLKAVKKDGTIIRIRLSVTKRQNEDGSYLCTGVVQLM